MNEKDLSKVFEKTISRRKLLMGLTSLAVLPFGQEAKAFSGFDPFSFGYVTGSYLTTGRSDNYKLLQESQLFLQDAVKGLNAEQPDFVLFGGDNVDAPGVEDANWQLFLDIAQGLNCPWNFVLGEQDISSALMNDPMKTYGRDWKGKGIERDTPYWSYDPLTAIHVVGLNTARRNSTVGFLDKAQLDWLKEDLKTNRHKFTIVASHHPLLPPAPFDGGSPWDDYVVPQGASAREIMGQFPSVRLALSGHVHINKIQQERSIWYVSSPSLAVYPCAYRIFRVTPDFVSVETYQISFPALVKKAKQKIETWSLPYKYSNKIEAFTDLMDGGKANQFAKLPMATGKPMEAMPVKKRKEAERSTKNHKGNEKAVDKPAEKSSKVEKSVDSDTKNSTTSDDKAPDTAAEEHKNMFGFGKKKKKAENSDKGSSQDLKNKSESKPESKSENQQSEEKAPLEKAPPESTAPSTAPANATPAVTEESKPDDATTKPIPELLSAPGPAATVKPKTKAKQQDKENK